MNFICILKYIFFSIGLLSILIIPILLKLQNIKKDNDKLEDQFFLIFLLLKRLDEEIEEIEKSASKECYEELKKSIEQIKLDFFGK